MRSDFNRDYITLYNKINRLKQQRNNNGSNVSVMLQIQCYVNKQHSKFTALFIKALTNGKPYSSSICLSEISVVLQTKFCPI